MTYDEAMEELGAAVADAYVAAIWAHKAAEDHDGAPVKALDELRASLKLLDQDMDTLISHGVTHADFMRHKRLYQGAKLAGMTE